MFNIRYSNEAEIDLDTMIADIAKESISNALAYLDRYESKIELLKSNPYMGVACQNKKINRDCRVLVFESHIIIYRVDDNSNEIVVSRLYHSREKYQQKFENSQ